MVMLVLLGLGGVSVYYQYTFRNVNQKFDDISANLDVCEQNLISNITVLKTVKKSLNSTETDIRKYDVLYEQKAEELEEKESELTDAQAELTRVKLQKEVYKRQIDAAYAQIIDLNRTLENLEKEIKNKENLIEDQKEEIACLLNTDDSDEYDCI